MENLEIARIFKEIADLLEIKGENPFRIRSYRNAAMVIEELSVNIRSIVERDEAELEEIPGVGKGIHEKIVEILKTGRSHYHQELLKEIPASLLQILGVSGVGPKKARLFYEKLGVRSLDDLEKAAKKGLLSTLPGMGKKSEEKIMKGITGLRAASGRYNISVGLSYADRLVSYIRETPGVKEAVVAGSLRRWKETIGDLDILVACRNGHEVMERFTSHPDVAEVAARGETKSSVLMRNHLQVDLRVVEERSFGAALQYFTGSKDHNVAVRDRAKRMGLKISEYGVFREENGEWLSGSREEDVYKAVGLSWIPPEIRENRGEIEAAEKARLPRLVEVADIRGDLHMHTRESDGADRIEELAEFAMKRGYEYIAVTDHSKAVGIAHGLNEERLARQMEEIDGFNEKLKKGGNRFRVLKGSEVDIKSDGSLDLDEDILKRLDVVIGSIHSGFSMPEKEMTGRIVRAIEGGIINIIAHPTGRLLIGRPPYSVDMEKVMDAAKRNGVAMEVNSYPERLDLNDVHCRMAREKGVRIAISTDAHNKAHMEMVRFGIHTARRGWIGADDVINTRPVNELLKILKR